MLVATAVSALLVLTASVGGTRPAFAAADDTTLIIRSADFSAIATSQEGLIVDWRSQIRDRAELLLGKEPVAYNSQDLLEGSREILRRTYDLGFMWRITGDQRYAARLAQELEAAAAFPKWNPKDDLSLGEMAHATAIGLDWLRNYLSSQQQTTISSAIVLKALEPAAEQYSNPASSQWVNAEGNWNVVVNAGVSLAALAVRDFEPTLSGRVLGSARQSIRSGLRAYSPDGSYFEGLTYWNYSTTYLVTLIAGLRTAAATDWGLLDVPGIRQTFQAPTHLLGPSGRSFAYGDAWSTESFTEPLLGLASLTGDPMALRQAVVGYGRSSADNVSARSLIWYLQSADLDAPDVPLDHSFPDTGIFAARSAWDDSRASFLAFKASSRLANGHTDLDAGTFVYDALGVRWFYELGADSYSLPGYFDTTGGQRWGYYRKAPEGQNSLAFDGHLASSARASSASFTALRPDVAAAVADLSDAAPAGVSWKRGVKLFDGRQQLLVQDEVQAGTPTSFWSYFHTQADIALAEDRKSAVLSLDGRQALVRLVSPVGAVLTGTTATPSPTSPQSLAQDGNAAFNKLAVRIEDTRSTTVTLQVTPLVPGQAPASRAGVVALSAWTSTRESAALTSLKVGGIPVPDFRADTLRYTWGTGTQDVVRTVSATAPTGSAVTVKQATGLPGSATVTVTRSGAIPQTYTISFVRAAMTVAGVSATISTNAANVVDGDLYSRWTASGFHRVHLDLGVVRRVNHVEVNWGVGGASGVPYNIQVSSDGASWQVVFEGTATSTRAFQWASFNTGPRNARYVRIGVNPDGQSRKVVINEVRAYGDNDPYFAESPVTAKPELNVPAIPELHVGDSHPVSTKVNDAPAAVGAVSHSSSNTAVARVSADRVEAVSAGRAVIVSEVSASGWLLREYTSVTVINTSEVVLKPSADAHVQGGAPGDTNFARSLKMYVRHIDAYPQFDRYAYVSFDLSGIAAAEIESAVLSATAKVEDQGGRVETLNARAVSSVWDPSVLTFNNRPAMGGTVGSMQISPIAARVSMDLTDYMKLRAGGVASFGITQDAPAGGVGQLSVIDTSRTSNSPTLTITLRDPGAPVLATPSISVARTDSGSQDGFVMGGASGSAGSTAIVQAFAAPTGQCLPVAESGSLIGETEVTFDASGMAAYTVSGGVPTGSDVFARLTQGSRVSTPSACQTPDAGEVVLTPSADVHVQGGSTADTNFRRSVQMYVRHVDAYPQYDRYAYLSFDLASIDAEQIESAVLSMTAMLESPSDRTETLNARAVSASWDAATLTFNTRPALETTLGSMSVSSSIFRGEIDLTEYMRSRAGGVASIAITQDAPFDGIGLLSVVDSSRSSNPPTLTITFTG
ncbi:CBM96 family carbohydrate-binding protein [Microbacterium sp. NPDC055455]